MDCLRLPPAEARCADIIWDWAPLTTLELVRICKEELGWARTTTYTVLKRSCQRGIFKMEKGLITVLLTKEEMCAVQGEMFVDDAYNGSLPAFVAAFASRKKLSEKDVAEIRAMLDSYSKK